VIETPDRLDPDSLPEPVRGMFLQATQRFAQALEAEEFGSADRWALLAMALGQFRPEGASR